MGSSPLPYSPQLLAGDGPDSAACAGAVGTVSEFPDKVLAHRVGGWLVPSGYIPVRDWAGHPRGGFPIPGWVPVPFPREDVLR